MSVLDTFFYTFKPKDEGVVPKLDEIQKKTDKLTATNEKVTESFQDFGKGAKEAIDKVLPGASKLADSLGKIGKSLNDARKAANTRTAASPVNAGGGGAGGIRPPPLPGAAGGAGAGGTIEGLGIAAGAAAGALAIATIAVAVFAKAASDGAEALVESRKKAQEAGINAVQQAALEQYAKSLKLDKYALSNPTIELEKKLREGWVTSRTFGNIFGIGNETTQLLKHRGINVGGRGGPRNAEQVMNDVITKSRTMSHDAGVALLQFVGLSKDAAIAIRDSNQSLKEYAQTHQAQVEQQAKSIESARKYEQAQQRLKNEWDTFAVKVGGKVIPIVTDLLEWIGDAADEIDHLVDAFQGFTDAIGDMLKEVFDWTDKALDRVTGTDSKDRSGAIYKARLIAGSLLPGASWLLPDDAKDAKSKQSGLVGDAVDYWAERKKGREKEKADRDKANDEYLKKLNQQTSDNAQAAKTQLEAANLMKVATAKFGLSLDQYMAIWAGETGKRGGLTPSGGIDAAGFRAAYHGTVTKYATPEVAEAMYFRGAPMMKQIPQQYAMGLGVTPLGIPTHAIGLAKTAVNSSNFSVGNGTASGVNGQTGTKVIPVNVNTGPITINTQSTDPDAINKSVSDGLTDHIKYAVNRLNDGQIA